MYGSQRRPPQALVLCWRCSGLILWGGTAWGCLSERRCCSKWLASAAHPRRHCMHCCRNGRCLLPAADLLRTCRGKPKSLQNVVICARSTGTQLTVMSSTGVPSACPQFYMHACSSCKNWKVVLRLASLTFRHLIIGWPQKPFFKKMS